MNKPPRRKLRTVSFARIGPNRIEKKRKKVSYLQDPNTNTIPSKSGIDVKKFAAELAKIADLIEQGQGLPEEYYRQSNGIDYILREEGWLHIHIGQAFSDHDTLLMVQQSDNEVLFICLTDHDIFCERPRGRSIKTLIAPSKISKDDAEKSKAVGAKTSKSS